MTASNYIMESDEEIKRLELKTSGAIVRQQARWAGLKPGHRVADIGCGTGKTTANLFEVVQPSGEAVGIDASSDRIEYALAHYGGPKLRFVRGDFLTPMKELGGFDFIWVRFILEYYGSRSFDIVRNLSGLLKPGGILCLIDIDHNCMCHHGLPERLSRSIQGIMHHLQQKEDFDPYAGRKLYSYLYDLSFSEIDVRLSAHHMIHGPLDEVNAFNWRRKVAVAARQSGYPFERDYPGGYDEFFNEFNTAFTDERRFIYTPLIWCRGKKPVDA